MHMKLHASFWSQQPDVRFLLSTGSTVAIQTVQWPSAVPTIDAPDESCGNKNNLVTSYKLTDTTWHDYRTLRIHIYPKNPGFSLYSHDRLGWDFRTLDPIRSGGVCNLPPASKTTWVSVWPVTPSASMDTCCDFDWRKPRLWRKMCQPKKRRKMAWNTCKKSR